MGGMLDKYLVGATGTLFDEQIFSDVSSQGTTLLCSLLLDRS
jgi:hypothetical protein